MLIIAYEWRRQTDLGKELRSKLEQHAVVQPPRVLFDKPADTVPRQAIPVHAITQRQLLDAPDRTLFRLGHSTVLLKLRGGFWITDPVFAIQCKYLSRPKPQRCG